MEHRVMRPKDADRMANSVDTDQTDPLGAVWSGSTLFAQTCLSENLGLLRYTWYRRCKNIIFWTASDQDLHCLQFRLHLLGALSLVKPSYSNFRVITANFLGVRIFWIFTVCYMSQCTSIITTCYGKTNMSNGNEIMMSTKQSYYFS